MKKILAFVLLSSLLWVSCGKDDNGGDGEFNTLTWKGKTYSIAPGGDNELIYWIDDDHYAIRLDLYDGNDNPDFYIVIHSEYCDREYTLKDEGETEYEWYIRYDFYRNGELLAGYNVDFDDLDDISSGSGKVFVKDNGGNNFSIRAHITFNDGERLTLNYQGQLTLD